MNKICKICGYNSENVWRDGKYYCASCGNEVDVTQADSNNYNISSSSSVEVAINVTCPICKNANNNTLRNGKCHCALCGSAFDITQQVNIAEPNADNIAGRREELEKQRNRKLIWGIVWLILFWPVSIYHFCKMYQISKEISKL